MDFLSGMAAAVDNVLDTVKLGYSIYQDQRDTKFRNENFAYQKALQQQMFQREDNAVQRRRADLEAAGLNPNLAAGSAAGAGSVVATSGASAGRQLQGGTDLLNSIIAYRQAQAQKTENEILKNERDIAEARKTQIIRANILNQIQSIFNSDSGIAAEYYLSPDGLHLYNANEGDLYNDSEGRVFLKVGNQFCPHVQNTRIWQLLKNGYDVNNADTKMLLYDADNYSMDRWIDRVSEGIGSVTDIVGSVTGGIKNLKGEDQVETESYTRNKQGYTRQRRRVRR